MGLEATYRESNEPEPAEWLALKQELEREKQRLHLTALASTGGFNVIVNGEDEDKLTRVSDLPTTQAVLIRSAESLGNGTHRISLLDGTTIEANENEWKRAHAKAIFQNIVRLSTWMIPKNPQPNWLHSFVPGAAAVVEIQEDGTSKPPGLQYHPDIGVIQEKNAPNNTTSQEDESYY